MIPTIGRIVLVNIGYEYTSPDVPASVVLRPAIIVRVWSETCINVRLFVDGYNDDRLVVGALPGIHDPFREPARANDWLTSITLGEGVGQWRWPPRA